MASRIAWGDLGIGVGTIVLALVAAWQVMQIPAEASYAQVGPQAVPWAVVAMLGGLGAALVVAALLGKLPEPEEHGTIDRMGLAWLGLGLALNLALIDFAGFIIASTCLFVCTARAFKSRQPLRDAGIGFALAFLAYIGFDRVLGYKIGSGWIERLF